MEKALVKKSDILKVKYKFFLNRVLIYFLFFLTPIFLEKIQGLELIIQSGFLFVYIIFMLGQWYLLGKELDHRLKIYYRVNSSIERVAYRIFSGSMTMLLLFNIFNLFPEHITQYLFWGFFGLLGLFYSWPTRGKIIEDSMTNQFGEMRFLDSFEKTIFLLTVMTFFISVPEIALFENIDALKLYLDPNESVNEMLWSYFSVLYLPMMSYPKLFNLAWSFHLYFGFLGLFLGAFYGLLRYFYSRRLSLLGIFAVVSTWTFSRILIHDFLSVLTTTVSLIWVWSTMWSCKSGTYRSGIFTGMVFAFATMVNIHNAILAPITLILFHLYFLKEQTNWYRIQWLKYNTLGLVIVLLIVAPNFSNFSPLKLSQFSFFLETVYDHIYRKAFYSIAPIGMILSFLLLSTRFKQKYKISGFDTNFKNLMVLLFWSLFVGLFVNPEFVKGFSFVWVLAFFSLIPLEWIFQSISRLRSKRNLIFALYILVCVLDSHLENRIRIVAKMFLNAEDLKYLIQF